MNFLGDTNTAVLAAGLIMAGVLLAVGAILGARHARGNAPDSTDPLSEGDRERVLELLHELESWTSEYSGNVNEYQVKLDELSQAVGASAGNSQAEYCSEKSSQRGLASALLSPSAARARRLQNLRY